MTIISRQRRKLLAEHSKVLSLRLGLVTFSRISQVKMKHREEEGDDGLRENDE